MCAISPIPYPFYLALFFFPFNISVVFRSPDYSINNFRIALVGNNFPNIISVILFPVVHMAEAVRRQESGRSGGVPDPIFHVRRVGDALCHPRRHAGTSLRALRLWLGYSRGQSKIFHQTTRFYVCNFLLTASRGQPYLKYCTFSDKNMALFVSYLIIIHRFILT